MCVYMCVGESSYTIYTTTLYQNKNLRINSLTVIYTNAHTDSLSLFIIHAPMHKQTDIYAHNHRYQNINKKKKETKFSTDKTVIR